MFLYQCLNRGKKIILISKHERNISETLKSYHISEELFDEIIHIPKHERKTDYIKTLTSIFIDDSFSERRDVYETLHIPVFDVDMVESLIDWRI